jgi:hypothetical protein
LSVVRLGAATAIALAFAASPVVADEAVHTILPLGVAVAGADADRAWIDAQLADANRVFAPAGLAFEVAALRSIAEGHARLETRDDRHALAAEVRPRVVNVFVVRSLRDVDEPERFRQGVHWRPVRGRARPHYVIVVAGAGPYVLAHELGHFFGNHQHSETPGNVMSYVRAGEPFFDAMQLTVIGRHVARFVRSGELRARPAGNATELSASP